MLLDPFHSVNVVTDPSDVDNNIESELIVIILTQFGQMTIVQSSIVNGIPKHWPEQNCILL